MMTTLFNRIALFLTIVALCACQAENQESRSAFSQWRFESYDRMHS